MVMFLMVLCLSMFGLAVTCLAFAAATGGIPGAVRERVEAQPEQEPAPVLPPPRFFVDELPTPVAQPQVPLEVLLAQIERHVRLEQAAAESFLVSPSAHALHSRTTSPLVH
jgi:hypothetical protein